MDFKIGQPMIVFTIFIGFIIYNQRINKLTKIIANTVIPI